MNTKPKGVKKRDANIELLRALTMIGVIILHINNPLIGGALSSSHQYPGLYCFLLFYESLFVCAVNLFLVITGYFMVYRKSINLKKPLLLVVQVVAFSVAFFVLGTIKEHTFSIKSLLSCFLPRNYFVIIYCSVYLLSPYINKLLCMIEQNKLRKLMLLMVLLFSIVPTVLDAVNEFLGINVAGMYPIGLTGSGYGYTFVNFLLLYAFGGYIRRIEKVKVSTKILVGVLFINVVLLSIWSHFSIGEGDFVESSSLSYSNPFIIMNAVIIFVLFLRITINNDRIEQVINFLAMPCFTVFLVHGRFFHLLNFDELIQQTRGAFALVIIALAVVVYLLSIIVGYVYIYIFEKMVKSLLNRIPILERLTISAE